MYFLNGKNRNLREQLIFGRDYDDKYYGMGGISYFSGMSIAKLRDLLEAGFIDPEETQNDSPSTQEILDFCSGEDEDIWYVHGYAVDPQRDDCRVTLEGFGSNEIPSPDRAFDFVKMNRFADTLEAESGEPVYCWYD